MDAKVISSEVRSSSLPESYARLAESGRQLSEVSNSENVPIIDMGCGDRKLIVRQIRNACRDYGCFQVINHGVAKVIVEGMQNVGNEFFRLPVEEKLKLYSDDPLKTTRLSMGFNETVHNLRLQCHPLEKYVPEWPSNPSLFKDIVSSYCIEVRQLGFRLEELMSESLGLGKDCLKDGLGEQGQHMALNYYPSCPRPELTYGLPGQTVPNNLTILLQNLDVAGLQLQVLKDGKWLAVKPHPDALVIYIGDQIQALSNGEYKSVWHRAIVNADQPRLSVASFLCPCDDSTIRALKLMDTEVNGYGSRQSIFAIAVPALIGFLQLKFQGNNKSPFESHPVLIIIALTSLLVYCLSYDFKIRISATRHRSPGYIYFLNSCIAFFGPLSLAALLSTLFPSVSPYLFAISGLFSLSQVPLSLVTTLWNWLRTNFRHLHHWISESAAVDARPPV